MSKVDPLVQALIDKLPDPKEGFSAQQQKAWLQMMELSLGVMYGSPPKPEPTSKGKPADNDYVFVIDEQGFVKGPDGTRLMPDEVSGTVTDLRPHNEAPIDGITWADGSKGLNGADIMIEMAP